MSILRGNLNEAISLLKIDVTFRLTSILANEIASSRFPWKIFLKSKLTITPGKINQAEQVEGYRSV